MKKEWWVGVAKKIIETLISVKVITIFVLMIVGYKLVLLDKMTGGEFAGMIGGVISVVYGLREGFKVAKVNSSDDSSDLKI